MVRKALALLVVVAVVGVALGAVGLWIPGLVGAHEHSATRSFPDGNSVGAGGELKVQITVSNFGNAATVKERLPEGFVYKSSDLPVMQAEVDPTDARNVTFAVVLESSPFTFTYMATAPAQAGPYDFSGTVDTPLAAIPDPQTIGGDTRVMVTASDMQMPMASREFSPSTVTAGESVTVTVTITASGYGQMGSVMETLPTGFVYTGSSLDDEDVSVNGRMVTFTLPAEGEMATEFTYTVTASDMPGMHDFMGELTDADDMTHTVGGAMMVTVEAAPVMMEGPRASRMILPASVMEGDDVRVTVTAMDYGQIGAVVETLPVGFSYVPRSSTLMGVEEAGRTLTFALLDPDQATFSYTAKAATAGPGTHGFSGNLIDDQQMTHMVSGESDVMVQARIVPGAPRAERSFSMSMTGFGDEVTVTIAAMNYGQIGAVVETIPMEFTYVPDSSSLPDVEMDSSGRELTFALLTPNNATFTYKVMTADTAGDYDFRGNLVDDQQMMHAVAGDTRITAGPNAMRSFSATVRTGANLEVMITARDYGSIGAVVETLPSGFTYVSSDSDDVEENGNEVTFALLDANSASFMYTVRAPSAAGSYDFMGRLIDDVQMSHDVTGDMTVMVQAPPTITEPEPTRPTPRRRGGGGGGGGGYAPPVATSTPVPTIAPTPTPIIVPTVVPATAAPTPEPTIPPPTEMPTARPKPTAEPPTEVPPTAMVEPTEPPAPTATTAPTVAPVTPVAPEAEGMPTWLIILIIVIIVAVVIAAVGFYLLRMRR